MSARVSIIIPCYNDAAWIGEAIQSCLDQSLPAHEIIVVDDGSTDRSVEVIRGFGKAVRLIESGHLGGCAARNLGWRTATAEWIQFLDSDDLLQPDKLRDHLPFALAAPAHHLTFCGSKVVDLETGVLRHHSTHGVKVHPLVRHYEESINPSMPLFPRAALEQVGGFAEGLKNCQDRDLHFRLWLEGYELEPIHQCLVTIRKRKGSVSSSALACVLNFPKVYAEAVTRADPRLNEPESRRLTARLFADGARGLACAGQLREAAKFQQIAEAADSVAARSVYGRVTRGLLAVGGVRLANLPYRLLSSLGMIR
jgi:glycosyltransferase involved in cell wall biosynthesis